MNLRLVGLAVTLAGAVALAGCGGDEGGPQPPGPDPFFPADFLTTYTQVRDCRFSVEHDLHSIQVYINPEAAKAYTDSIYPFAAGTICVKPEYTDPQCSQIAAYAVMRKGPPGTAPDGGDWEWQIVGADLKVVRSAQTEGCVDCHALCTNGRDFTCTDP